MGTNVVDSFNRVVVILLGATLLPASIIAVLIVTGALSVGSLGLDGWVESRLQELQDLRGDDRSIATAAGIGGAIVGFLLLALQAIPVFSSRRLYGSDTAGNKVILDNQTVERLAEDAAAQVDGVESAHSSFRDTKQGIEVYTTARVDPSANLVEVSREVDENIKKRLAGNAGITVARNRLKLKHGRGRKASRRTTERV